MTRSKNGHGLHNEPEVRAEKPVRRVSTLGTPDIDSFELHEKIRSRYNGGLPLLMVLAGTAQFGRMTLEELPADLREKVAKTLQGLSAQ